VEDLIKLSRRGKVQIGKYRTWGKRETLEKRGGEKGKSAGGGFKITEKGHGERSRTKLAKPEANPRHRLKGRA